MCQIIGCWFLSLLGESLGKSKAKCQPSCLFYECTIGLLSYGRFRTFLRHFCVFWGPSIGRKWRYFAFCQHAFLWGSQGIGLLFSVFACLRSIFWKWKLEDKQTNAQLNDFEFYTQMSFTHRNVTNSLKAPQFWPNRHQNSGCSHCSFHKFHHLRIKGLLRRRKGVLFLFGGLICKFGTVFQKVGTRKLWKCL